MPERVRPASYVPGLSLLAVGAVTAHAVASTAPWLNALVVAVGLGFAVGNTAGIPSWAERGVAVQGLFLETGIVLLGASLTVSELLRAGPRLGLLIAGTILFGIGFVEVTARLAFRIDGPVPSLLAAGASICGVSAVAAIGTVIGARGEQRGDRAADSEGEAGGHLDERDAEQYRPRD